MKKVKWITITILLIITVWMGKPFVVNAQGTTRLEACEKKALKNIFNKSDGKTIETSYDYLALEFYKVICDCSYYDCVFKDDDNYDLDKNAAFVEFAQKLFTFINRYGDASFLKKTSNKNKHITEFEELLDLCYIDDTANIDKYYNCSVNNICTNITEIEYDDDDDDGGSEKGGECTGFIGQETADFIKEVLDYIRALGPLAVIIYSALDLARAVAGKYDGNEDALATAKEKINKRIIACLLLIFIPTILKVIFKAVEGTITFPTDCVMMIQNMFLRR